MDKVKKIDVAVKEANRFIAKAFLWKRRIVHDKLASISGCKEGEAAKRSSMDLSRALAELRKS